MPKLTLVLGRKPMKAFDLDQDSISVGREPGVDIVIDNVSVSREHCELRKDGDGWIVADLGSSNGTYLNGNRIGSGHPIVAGDEIGIGKFSLLFEKELDLAPEAKETASTSDAIDYSGTIQIGAKEVEKLLDASSKKRKAHIAWESGGRQGEHQLEAGFSVLIGTDDLCDIRVPKGPKHHLLFIRTSDGYEVRNLAMFAKMTVGGRATKKARLKDGDTVEMSGAKLTFADEL